MKSPLREPFAKKVNGRIRIFTALLLAWAALLVGRLVQLQIFRHAASEAEVLEQSRNTRTIFPNRGTIFDRNGQILARSIPVRSLFLMPVKGEGAEAQRRKVLALAKALGLGESETQDLQAKVRRGDPFIYIKRKAPSDTAAAIEAMKLPGVASHADTMRFYPNGPLAAHVLGGVSIDNNGQAGVEYSYNEPLQGRTGKAVILMDARRREYYFETLTPTVPGHDIILTIDATLQYIAERELGRAVQATSANWGVVLISYPASGEILAMASCPTYDPNAFGAAEPSARFNRAIQLSYEPGSTFKIVAASAALARHAVGMKDFFDCSRTDLDIPGKPIRDHKEFGWLSFPQVVINSSNRGMVQVGQRVGPEPLFETATAFGFGRKAGIDLAGESAGRLQPLATWSRRTIAAMSTGYEIAATPLQIMQAINTLANRGVWTPPRIVRRVVDPAQRWPPRPPQEAARVLPREAAESLTGILEQVVQEGTGVEAKLDGYRVAGKTGTTQKWDAVLKVYSEKKHTASFAGFVPADKPALSIVVIIDEPKGAAYYGGDVAAPVFREIASRALRAIGVYPELPPAKGVISAAVLGEARQ
jgi:cell division protein FtsI/penicillin-binding protein 2